MLSRKPGVRLAATALVLAALGPASSQARPTASCAGFVPGPQRTIGATAKATPKAVARGEVVKISIYTFRPPDRRFLDVEGLDPPGSVPRQPAGNVNVTLGVESGGGYAAQNIGTKTNDEGRKTVKMRLDKYHYEGPAEVVVNAWIDHYKSDQCVEVQEYGNERFPNAFVIR